MLRCWLLLVGVVFGACAAPAGAAITVTPASDLDALARQMLGPGVTLSGSAAKNDANLTAFGSYTGASELGADFDRGVVLSSGENRIVLDPSAPGYVDDNAYDNGAGSDPDLVWSFPGRPNRTPIGAATLSFDVVPVGPSLRVPFVFGSEEYAEIPANRYEDRMAILVGGAQCAKVDGQLPSTASFDESSPVASNPGFVDNTAPVAGRPGFAGYSRPGALACEASVTPGQPVRVKLAVSDVYDHNHNSGLLVAAGGITSAPIPPSDGTNPTPAGPVQPAGTTAPPARRFRTTVGADPTRASYGRLRRGVSVAVTVSARSRIDVALTVPRKVGRRVGSRTIAKARKTATRAGKVTLTLRVGRKVARRLRAFRTISARLVVTVTPASGRPVKRKVAVTLRR